MVLPEIHRPSEHSQVEPTSSSEHMSVGVFQGANTEVELDVLETCWGECL